MLEIFGEQIMYPGLDPVTGKFTDGDFSNPLIKPSHIPAASFNLILDNLENLIQAMGFDPNNTDPDQLKNALLQGFAPRTIGSLHFFERELSVPELVRLRLLPLKGQLIEISDYQELFDLKYCGDANNGTADWWYKCDQQGNRMTTGLWTRPTDWRGLFPRVAGANSKYKAADNTPYDGMSVGSHIPDAMPKLNGSFSGNGFLRDNPFYNVNGIIYPVTIDNQGRHPLSSGTLDYSTQSIVTLAIDSSRVFPRIANQVRAASMAVLAFISY